MSILHVNKMDINGFCNVNNNLVLPNNTIDGGEWVFVKLDIPLNDKLVDYAAKFLNENWVALLSKLKENNIEHECLVGCVVY